VAHDAPDAGGVQYVVDPGPLVAPRACRSARPALATTVVTGLAVGIGTQVLQGVLPDTWSVLANSGVMWALMAFALGAVLPTARWGALGGAAQLVIASVVYYAAVDWFEGNSSELRGAIIWSAAGIVAGSAFGIAGYWCRRHPERRFPALALVAGVLAGEGVHLAWWVGNAELRPAGVVELGLAAVLLAVCLVGASRRPPRRATTLVAGIGLGAAIATLAAVDAIDAVFLAV
jgi:hypothetical protein